MPTTDDELLEDEETERRSGGGQIRRMPDEEEVGPFFPSGMSAPETVLAGGTGGMDEEQAEAARARLRGEETETQGELEE